MAFATELHSAEIGFAHLVSNIRDSLARRKVYRNTVRELRGLSNRELSDLGMSRSMITRVALEATYGK